MNSNLNRFIKQFSDLFDKLLEIIPNDKDLKVFKMKFDLLKEINPQLIIISYINYVLPYKLKIMGTKNDFEYFIMNVNINDEITKNNKKILNDIKENNIDSDFLLNKILNLKNIWMDLNINNKEVIYTYFKVLTKLCENYIIQEMRI